MLWAGRVAEEAQPDFIFPFHSGRREGRFFPHRHPPSVLIPPRRAHRRRVGHSRLQPRRARNMARTPTWCVCVCASCLSPFHLRKPN